MNIGDVVAMNGCKIEFGTKTEGGAVTYRAPKGERFVFLLLGSTPIDGSAPLDPDDVLKELGWSPTSPEMGEISREDIARIIDPLGWELFDEVVRIQLLPQQESQAAFLKHPDAAQNAKDRTETSLAKVDQILSLSLSKLKENGLSREGLGGSARAGSGAACPSDCAEGDARLSDGGRG